MVLNIQIYLRFKFNADILAITRRNKFCLLIEKQKTTRTLCASAPLR